jgi:hypothetical protein
MTSSRASTSRERRGAGEASTWAWRAGYPSRRRRGQVARIPRGDRRPSHLADRPRGRGAPRGPGLPAVWRCSTGRRPNTGNPLAFGTARFGRIDRSVKRSPCARRCRRTEARKMYLDRLTRGGWDHRRWRTRSPIRSLSGPDAIPRPAASGARRRPPATQSLQRQALQPEDQLWGHRLQPFDQRPGLVELAAGRRGHAGADPASPPQAPGEAQGG